MSAPDPSTPPLSGPGAPSDRDPGAAQRLGLPGRLAWAALCLVAILGLCLLRVRIHGDTTLADVYSAPEHFDGIPVDLATEAVIVSLAGDGFTLRELEREIFVRNGDWGTIEPDDVGRFVHVRGTFHAARGGEPAWVEPFGVRVHRGRRMKIWISLLPLAWVGILCLMTFRFRPSRLALEPRRA